MESPFSDPKVREIAEKIGSEQTTAVMKLIQKVVPSDELIDIWYTDSPPIVSYSFEFLGTTVVGGFSVAPEPDR